MPPLPSDMNITELTLAAKWPALTRINSANKPTAITVVTTKNMNPDFALMCPPFGGIWVELKGHIKDAQWIPTIRQWPDWLKTRYKVVLVSNSKKQRTEYQKALHKAGIQSAHLDMHPTWVAQALELYVECAANEPHLLYPTNGRHHLAETLKIDKFKLLVHPQMTEEEAKEMYYGKL